MFLKCSIFVSSRSFLLDINFLRAETGYVLVTQTLFSRKKLNASFKIFTEEKEEGNSA